MDGKDACDRQSNCSCPCGKLQKCCSHEKIMDEAGSVENLSPSIRVLKSCDKGQAYFKAALRHVMQTMLVSLESSEAHFIFLSSLGDCLNELIVLRFLISLASDTAYLEEMAKGFEIYPGDGNFMNNVGVMLTRRMKYNLSEKCFLGALHYFQHKEDHMRIAVVTVNLAAFHRICGDLKKAHSYCNNAVELCLVITSAPPTDLHLLWKVVFRLNLLCQKLKNYKSYHDILRVAVKFGVDGTSDAFAVKYMKQLITLQLKEQEGEKNKHEELEEFALQLFAADAFMKPEPLTAEFITTVMTLAEMYCSIKCLKEARQLIDKLESTFLHVYGGNGPLFGFLQYQIGHFKVKYCEASEAQSTLQKAEEIFIRCFGRGYHMVGSCKSLQGTCASHKGNQKAASHYLKEARTIFEKINHHHPKVGEILLKAADLESKAGNFENANLIIEAALEKFILACGKVSLETALAYLQGASILRRKGKFMRSALVKVKKANDIFVHHGLHHDHPDVAFCHCLQGQLLHSLGQVKEAEEEFLFVHHQLSSQNDLSMRTEVIDPELYQMFFLVDVDGLALRDSRCSHFLSLVSLADVKTGDEKRDHMKEIFSCLERLDSTILTVSDYLGKHVHCTLQRILEADIQVYFILIPDSATPLGEDESVSSKYSNIEKKQPGDYENVYLLSSCVNSGKAPQLLLFWKTSDVLETGDVSFVTSSFRESVKLLCLQPKFRKTYHERQELFMKMPIQEKSPAVPSLSSRIDSLPLLVELELSKSHNQCDSIDSFPTASTIWPLAHVSYFSYRFSSSNKALLVFYKWISSLGRKLELSEVRSISTPEVSSPSQRNCAVHFTFFDPICASLSLAVEERSVHVKCRTVKESGSTCICSSVRTALESTVEAQEADIAGSVSAQSLWLPCVEDDNEYGKEPTKGYSHCKDSQQESSSISDQKLDLHPPTNWESNSDKLKKEPSVDLSQNEDTECPSFTTHPDDTIGTDACVQPLECILRKKQLSSGIHLSGINNPLNTANGAEERVNSLLSPGSSSSLNYLPSSQIDASNEKLEFKQEALLYLEDFHGETCSGKEAGNVLDTSLPAQAVFFNSHYHESANCEEGLIADYQCSLETKKSLQRNKIPQKTCSEKRVGICFNKEESREDHGIEFDQSPIPSFTTAERENDKGTVAIESIVCDLQDEVAFYQDQCSELREELVKLREKWKLCENEKQDLQAEVGRHLFLESKGRRRSKIYQPLSEHASRTSMPGRVRGASRDFPAMEAKLLGGADPLNKSGFLLQQRLQEISISLSELELSRIKSLVRPLLDCLRLARIREGSELFEELERKGELSYSFVRDLLERIHRFDLVEKLAVPFHNGSESYRGESYLSQENNPQNKVSESVSDVDGRQCDEVEEWNDIFDNTEADGEVQFCNSSNIDPFNSDSEVAAITFHAEIMNESSFIDVDLSKERCDSASSLSQSFDVPSIGVISEERSQSPSGTGEQFESGQLKGACGAGVERGIEGSYESTLRDGAEGQFNCNHHFNDTEDGAVNLSDRAQDSLMPEDLTGVNQDSLPHGDTTQEQNVSDAKITAKKDRAVDQSGSHVSNESNKWEHSGARPRDRPPKIDRSSEPSFLYSLENLVPPQVGGPMAHGVANAFLARHSEDKHLHESLYYTNAEEMFTENSSLLGASHVDGMINLLDSNKAKQNLGDCQCATRPDSYNQPHSSLLPQSSGAYIGGNNGLNTDFNSLNPNIANDFAPCTGMQDGTFPYLQRDELLHSGFTGSGLTSDFMQATGSQTGAFNMSNSNFSINHYALGTREPQIPLDRHFTSLQINQPIRSGFRGSGFSIDLTGTTGREMTHSAAGTRRNSDFSGRASILPSTTNPGLPGTSSVNMQTYDYRPDASPTTSSGARANGSNNGLSAGLESSSSHLLSFATGRDVLNTSSQGNSSTNTMNTSGDCVASGHYREGSRAHNSSSSGLISGINTGGSLNQQSGQTGDSVANRNYDTESVEQRVEEACAMVEGVLREREERDEFGREIERKEREIRAERARKKREREARELEEARGWPQQQEPVTGQSLWLCEHYQRHCRVRFPCCTNFYSCHRCHNNSKECDNEEAKASHATHLKCSYCHHEQEIAEDSAKCRSCGAKMSAYFCGICKHFTSIDKNPYHCDKCGICRIHKDKSFHCDVCNVCLDKRLQGKHKCRPDSGHDECCICLEDAFSGCQILPCSHKVHRECAIAMIQNGIRTCPVCRHPLYSPAPE